MAINKEEKDLKQIKQEEIKRKERITSIKGKIHNHSSRISGYIEKRGEEIGKKDFLKRLREDKFARPGDVLQALTEYNSLNEFFGQIPPKMVMFMQDQLRALEVCTLSLELSELQKKQPVDLVEVDRKKAAIKQHLLAILNPKHPDIFSQISSLYAEALEKEFDLEIYAAAENFIMVTAGTADDIKQKSLLALKAKAKESMCRFLADPGKKGDYEKILAYKEEKSVVDKLDTIETFATSGFLTNIQWEDWLKNHLSPVEILVAVQRLSHERLHLSQEIQDKANALQAKIHADICRSIKGVVNQEHHQKIMLAYALKVRDISLLDPYVTRHFQEAIRQNPALVPQDDKVNLGEAKKEIKGDEPLPLPESSVESGASSVGEPGKGKPEPQPSSQSLAAALEGLWATPADAKKLSSITTDVRWFKPSPEEGPTPVVSQPSSVPKAASPSS